MNASRPLRIGTRGSRLARWQAEWVATRLEQLPTPRQVELVEVSTAGDRDRYERLDRFGTTGVFTKQIQAALLDDRVDVAVHSLKDLPTETPSGLVLAAVPPRGHVRDVLIARHATSLDDLPRGARVATGSPRRRAQLLHHNPDLVMCDVRGNVETRIGKLDRGDYDAMVLAEAGLVRLGLDDRITEVLAPPLLLPAAGQGALAIECRSDDALARSLVEQLNHPESEQAVRAERALLAALRAGCHAPVGVLGTIEDGRLVLEAVVLSADGRQRLEARATADAPVDAAELGRSVAADLVAQGASALMEPSGR